MIPQSLVTLHGDDEGENRVRFDDVLLWDQCEFSRPTLDWPGGIRTNTGVARAFRVEDPTSGTPDLQSRTLIVPESEDGPEVLHDTAMSTEDWTIPYPDWLALARASWPEEPAEGSLNAFGKDTMKRLHIAGISPFAHCCYLRSVRAVGPRALKLRRGFLKPTPEYRGDPPTGFLTWMGAPTIPTDGSGDHHLHYGDYAGTPNDIALDVYEFDAYAEPITESDELATGVQETVPVAPLAADLPDTAEVATDQASTARPGSEPIPRLATPDPASTTRPRLDPIPR